MTATIPSSLFRSSPLILQPSSQKAEGLSRITALATSILAKFGRWIAGYPLAAIFISLGSLYLIYALSTSDWKLSILRESSASPQGRSFAARDLSFLESPHELKMIRTTPVKRRYIKRTASGTMHTVPQDVRATSPQTAPPYLEFIEGESYYDPLPEEVQSLDGDHPLLKGISARSKRGSLEVTSFYPERY